MVGYIMAKSKYIAVVSLLSAFSGVLQVFIAPLMFSVIQLPFGHDLIVFFFLLLSVWVVRRFGGATGVGVISSLVVLFLRPGMFLVIGFVISSFIFDLLMFVVKHSITFSIKNVFAVSLSIILSAYVAGVIIGLVFMGGTFLWAFSIWGPLHAFGGAISLILSYPVLVALERTGVRKGSGF